MTVASGTYGWNFFSPAPVTSAMDDLQEKKRVGNRAASYDGPPGRASRSGSRPVAHANPVPPQSAPASEAVSRSESVDRADPAAVALRGGRNPRAVREPRTALPAR